MNDNLGKASRKRSLDWSGSPAAASTSKKRKTVASTSERDGASQATIQSLPAEMAYLGKASRKRSLDWSGSPAAASTSKKRKTVASTSERDGASQATIQSLPAEMVEEILSWMSVGDVIAFGATCRAFHQLSLSPALWKALCRRLATGPRPDTCTSAHNWRRTAILHYTQALHLQALGRAAGRRRPWVMQAVTPNGALGFKRVLPTCDNYFLWDYSGTVFMLSDSVSLSPSGELIMELATRSSVLCRNVKDVAVDPRTDLSYRQYVYVLVSRPYSGLAGSTSRRRCNSVEIYKQDSGERVFYMSFHPSLTFSQLRLMGSAARRTLLLLADSGKVYTVLLNETQMNRPRSLTVQLNLRKLSHSLPDLPVKQIHTSHSSALYITGDGAAYVETLSGVMHQHLFGSQAGFNPNFGSAPKLFPIPYKVVKCSVGFTHLCLLDERGRMFMQGSNNHGQLGTGDKIDRRDPTQVVLSLCPVDVCCGLNHSLALLRGETGEMEVHGCGCGRGGRLPGWAQGSPIFVRLRVKAPRSAHTICISKNFLFLLCCHDIDEPVLFRSHPPGMESQNSVAERMRLLRCLSDLRGCGQAQEQLAMLREAVQSHITLSSTHRDFLEEAFAIMQQPLFNHSREPTREAS